MRHNGPNIPDGAIRVVDGTSPTGERWITPPRAACWLCDDAPAPSSPAAIERGCTCPTSGNGGDHLGIEWDDTRTVWAVASDCPLHARGLPHSKNRAEALYPPEAAS